MFCLLCAVRLLVILGIRVIAVWIRFVLIGLLEVFCWLWLITLLFCVWFGFASCLLCCFGWIVVWCLVVVARLFRVCMFVYFVLLLGGLLVGLWLVFVLGLLLRLVTGLFVVTI